VAAALDAAKEAVKPGVSTADLDAVAEQVIRDAGAVPSFLGYHGYPASTCTSVNEEVVHAIPSPHRILAEGDVITIDCGAILDGWHGDAAVTVPVGEVDPEVLRMAWVAEEAMWAGIAQVRAGNHLSDIGHAIESVAKAARYSVVREYVGHGIGTAMHEEPQVPNYGRPGRGLRLEEGLVLAIEPMLNEGGPETRVLEDGWTVVTRDGSRSAHFEHTVAITPDGPEVLTLMPGARQEDWLPKAG